MTKTRSRKFIAESIRMKYIYNDIPENSFDALSQLKELDRRTKIAPTIFAIIFGIFTFILTICGLILISLPVYISPNTINRFLHLSLTEPIIKLIFCLIGTPMALFGTVFMIVNYFIYSKMVSKRRAKIKSEVIRLSEKILNEVDFINEPAKPETIDLTKKGYDFYPEE